MTDCIKGCRRLKTICGECGREVAAFEVNDVVEAKLEKAVKALGFYSEHEDPLTSSRAREYFKEIKGE